MCRSPPGTGPAAARRRVTTGTQERKGQDMNPIPQRVVYGIEEVPDGTLHS